MRVQNGSLLAKGTYDTVQNNSRITVRGRGWRLAEIGAARKGERERETLVE